VAAGLCPACRHSGLPAGQRRRLERQALVIMAFLFFLMALVLIWPFSTFLLARHGWVMVSLLIICAFVVLFAIYVVGSVARLLAGSWRLRRPAHALAVAQTCAGEPGTHTHFGNVSIQVLGQDDPTPMLEAQAEVCRRRFESLLGEPLDPAGPLRVLAFARRAAFDGFCRRMLLDPGNLDGLYIPWSTRTIILTGEFPPYRLADPQRVVRTLFSYFYLDELKKCPVPVWIQAGIANFIALGGDASERARLNRKMLASLARGTTIGAAGLFQADPRAWLRLLRNWQDLASFMKYTQLASQAHSVVEFLGGDAAPAGRQQQFRAFLREIKLGATQEAVFVSHFGHGFEAVLEQWKAWVTDQGVGVHESPPEPIRQALLGRMLPLIRQRDASPLDRLQAIRDIGKAGYVLGADALIDVLADDDQIAPEEPIWALEAISGLSLGDDAEHWSEEWLAGLPEDVTGLVSEPAG
jgi:hypothetical protein